MTKVKVTHPYFDRERDEYPEVNSEFEVEEKRAKGLTTLQIWSIIKLNGDMIK